MDDENDEEECESVNEQSVNVNKTPQEHVTKTGPDNLLEKNLKRIIYKKPQKHKARVDPDGLLRKSLKKVVYGRLGLETAGVRRLGQSLRQKQSEVSDPGHSPGTDIGVTGSWNAEPWGTDPAGLDLGEGGQRDQEPGEEELVIETMEGAP